MSVESPLPGKIALFGFYGLGNFGDDLMGWMLARHLVSIRYPVCLFSLSDTLVDSLTTDDFSQKWITTSRDIDEILDGASGAVFGGGGLFVEHAYSKLRRFSKYFERTEQIIHAMEKEKIPLALVSVGGDGAKSTAAFSPLAKRALAHASLITTRNQSDSDLLSSEGIPSRFFHDIVWTATTFGSQRPIVDWCTVQRSKKSTLRIGLDLYASNAAGKGLLRFLTFLYSLAWLNTHIEWVVLNSKHISCGGIDAMGTALSGAAAEHYRFRRFDLDFEKIASLDLLISSRLHVPIVALQMGVPVISVFAEDKTKVFFDAVGLSNSFYGIERMSELRSSLSNHGTLCSWLESYPFPDIATLCSGAFGHFRALEDFVLAKYPVKDGESSL